MLSGGIAAFDRERAKLIHYRHLAEHASPPQAEPFDVSFIPPNAYWSAADKSTFFHAIARHSRWRPDLICDELGGSKSIADVCSYIGLLEQGLWGGRDTSSSRDTLPIAREVSEDWMRTEDSMAESLQNEETGWYIAALKRKRQEEVRAVEKSLRQEGQQETTVNKDQQSSEEEKMWQERLKQRKKEFAAVWNREDLLLSLDGEYLKAMEAMIRTLEEDEKKEQLQPEGSNSPNQTQLPRPVSLADTTPVQSSTTLPSSREPQPHPNSSFIDNSNIDPTLLALNNTALLVVPSIEETTASGKNPGPSGLRSASLSPRRSPSNDDNSSGPFKFPPDLSPDSRRRIRKRLWMRRKRALKSGLSVSEVSRDIRKLKPGRKGTQENKKEGPTATDAEKQEKPSSVGNDANGKDGGRIQDTEVSQTAVKRKPPGWAELESLGIDAVFLRTAGLDLFSLGKYSHLASLMNDVYQSPDEADGSMPELSYSFLLLLRAHLHYFLSRVIGQIITQQRIETQQKMRVRGKKSADRALKIRPNNVNTALKIMEYPSTSEQFFRRLKKNVRDVADSGDPSKTSRERRGPKQRAVSEDSSSDNNIGSDSETEATNMSESQDTSSSDELTPSMHSTFPHSFIPQTEFQLMWDVDGGVQGDVTQLSDDLDEDELAKELKAEEELDVQDQVADRELEDILWEEIGVRRISEQLKRKAKRPAEAKSLTSIRLRKPGGAIKSSVYIDDSDEDDGEGPDQ